MRLDVLTREQCQQVRIWRNDEPQFLRTPYLLTEQMQDEFYEDVINDRDSKHRYFGLVGDANISENKKGEIYGPYGKQIFIGMGGLTNIEWENGTAEISLIINPEYRRQGKGKEAVDLILDEAFKNMRLHSVYGEVYDCGNRQFWEKIVSKQNVYSTNLKGRKYWNNQYYGSMWFYFTEKEIR